MSALGEAARRLTIKLNSLLGKEVTVVLRDGKRYTGKVSGLDAGSLTLALEPARDGEGNSWPLAIISGGSISEILVTETSKFNAEEFAEFLIKYGGFAPHSVKVYPESNVVEVSRSVRVTKDGVEGAGPLAQRVYTLYKEYLRRSASA
ncbi:Lsm family RNA-binding protein [Stetteria hydrogenophila]